MRSPGAAWISVGARSVRKAQDLLREVEERPRVVSPILVAGAPTPVVELSRALVADGDPAAVRRVGARELAELEREDGSALVYVIRGRPTASDERVLRRASAAGIPLVCVALVPDGAPREVLPYVLATDVVRSSCIDGRTAERVGERIAARAPDDAWALGQRLPRLRRPVALALVRREALRAAELAASDSSPDGLAALALGQAGTVLRLGATAGSRKSALPLAVALAAGTGLAARACASRIAAGGLGSRLVPAGAAALVALAAGSAAAAWLFRAAPVGAAATLDTGSRRSKGLFGGPESPARR